jgi:hypothetical protein
MGWCARDVTARYPSGHRHAVGMTLFATAAAVLIVNAVHNLHLFSDSIPGESLSLGIGAAIVAADFADGEVGPGVDFRRSRLSS